MKLAPLHIRQVNIDKGKHGTYQKDYVYVFGKFRGKLNDFPDLLTLFSDVYGVPSSFDYIEVEDNYEPMSFITEDHIKDDTIVISPEHYPGEVHIDQAQRSLNNAVTRHLMESAKKIGLSNDEISENLKVADDNNVRGAYRIYALNNKKLDVHARFSVYMSFSEDSPALGVSLGDIQVSEGEFGRGGI